MKYSLEPPDLDELARRIEKVQDAGPEVRALLQCALDAARFFRSRSNVLRGLSRIAQRVAADENHRRTHVEFDRDCLKRELEQHDRFGEGGA